MLIERAQVQGRDGNITICHVLWKKAILPHKRTLIRFSKYPAITLKSCFLNFGLKIPVHTAKIREKKDSYRKSWFINDFELICGLKAEGNDNFWTFSAFFAHFCALKVS